MRWISRIGSPFAMLILTAANQPSPAGAYHTPPGSFSGQVVKEFKVWAIGKDKFAGEAHVKQLPVNGAWSGLTPVEAKSTKPCLDLRRGGNIK